MNEKLRAYLESIGLDKDASTQDAWRFYGELEGDQLRAAQRIKKGLPAEETNDPEPDPDPQRVDVDAIAARAAERALENYRAEQERQRQQREALAAQIRSDCEFYGVAGAADELIGRGLSLEDARAEIRERRANQPLGLTFAGDQRDKHVGAVRTALLLRCYRNSRFSQSRIDKIFPVADRSEGHEDFRHARLSDMARECLHSFGVSTRGMSLEQLARTALCYNHERTARSDYGWHTTGSFPQLTLDAVNKTLLMAYEEKPMTWRRVFRQAESTPDFKNIHRIRLSEAPNLDLWPDNTDPNEIRFGDEKETYAVEARANEVSFSWQLLVNDDMDALSRVPALMGRAAERTINAAAWSVVTSNPTMTDGQSLFSDATGNRQKDNLGTGGAISKTTLGEARKLMRLQVGVNQPDGSASEAILNLEPRFLVVPAALETTAQEFVLSLFDPTDSKFQVHNQFRNLELVVEAVLDANSAAAWYMFADSGDIDTIEVTFLQGQETPVVDSWQDQSTLALKYRIMQTFAPKAIDHRGCFKNAGS